MASEMLKKALLTVSAEEFLSIDKECKVQNWIPSEEFIRKTEKIVKGKRRSFNMGRVLIAAAIILLMSSVCIFSFADLRENIINTFKEFYYTYFDVEYGNNQPGDITGNGIEKVYTLVLPEDFEMIQHNKNEHSVITIWENADGETLILSQGDGITKRSIDNERLACSSTVIDGVQYEIYTESGYVLVLWNTDEYTFSLDYYGERSSDEIVSFAEVVE